jgi:hypothetical protein
MKSQAPLPIQYISGSKPEITRGLGKNPDSPATSRTSFQTSLNESIIDVYERSEVNVAVPDERTGVDRRTSSTRRHSSSESAALQSGKNATDVGIYSTEQKINHTYNKTEQTRPAFFSPSPKKGSLIDTWA